MPRANTEKVKAQAREFIYPDAETMFPISRIAHYTDDVIAPYQDGYYLIDCKGNVLTSTLPITIVDWIHEAMIAYKQHLDSKCPEYGKRGKLIGSILIPLNPITKKNSQQIVNNVRGRPFVIPSKTYTKALTDIKRLGNTIWIKQPDKASLPITEPICVTCHYYRDSHRRVDLTNLESAVMDILVAIGILQDDNSDIVICTDGSRVFYDKEHARTEINIYEWRY